MKNNISLVYNVYLIIGDLLALVAAIVCAYILRVRLHIRLNPQQLGIVHPGTYIEVFLTLLPFWILIFALLGLYNSSIYENRFKEAGRLLVGSFIGMLFVISWNFIAAKPIFPARLIPVYGFILGFIFLVAFRNIARFIRTELFTYNIGLTNVLLIGNAPVTKELVDWLSNSHKSGYNIIGIVGQKSLLGGREVPTYRSFQQFLGENKETLHCIIQTELYSDENKNSELLSYAQENHVSYRFVPANSGLFVGNLEVELFRSTLPVVTVHQTALFGWGRIVKRLFDFGVSSLLLIILSPFFLVIAIIIKLSGGGSIFYRQTRLTRFNQQFRVFKFHTQYPKYDGPQEEVFAKMGRLDLLEEYRANGNYLPHDPRITPIGRFLRSTSLDELPQLLNVWRGELSLVGPRALIPSDLAAYKKRHTILSVKSGITGLAQVSGRNNIPVEERRSLDLYYVQNWSFWLDLIILIKTFGAVFSHEYDNK